MNSQKGKWIRPEKATKAVLVLTHGMNLNPERMDDLALAFAALGYEVFRPIFTAHTSERGDEDLLAEKWERDAEVFYQTAARRAEELGVPLLLGAYSFSALIYQVMEKKFSFAARVYFAPALATHFWYPLVISIARMFPKITMKTMIPKGYFARPEGSFDSLVALHHFMSQWRTQKKNVEQQPTLVWASLGDELVHGKNLKKFSSRQKGWEFRSLSIEGSTLPRAYHHLIIDKAALGPIEFARVVKETDAFYSSNL